MVSILSHALAFVSPTVHSSTVLPKMAHLIEYKYNPAWISSNCFCVHCNVVLCSVSVMSRILKRISMLYHILKNHTHSAVGRCIRNSTRSHLYSTSSLLTSLPSPLCPWTTFLPLYGGSGAIRHGLLESSFSLVEDRNVCHCDLRNPSMVCLQVVYVAFDYFHSYAYLCTVAHVRLYSSMDVRLERAEWQLLSEDVVLLAQE